MSGLIDPKRAVEDGRRLGLIGITGEIHLPEEAGLAKPIKIDRRMGKRTLRGAYKSRYVIFPKERPELFLPGT